MLLADQVCSPEQALFFDSVGLKIRSTFFWLCFYDIDLPREQRAEKRWDVVDLSDYWMEYSGNPRYRQLKQYKAYNCAELGFLLPGYPFCFVRNDEDEGKWAPYNMATEKYLLECKAPTEAQAKAALLRRLIETQHLQVEKLSYTSSFKTLGGS